MALGTDVVLKDDADVLFPEKCVVCGLPTEYKTDRLEADPPPSYFGGFKWLAGKTGSLRFPLHSRCSDKLKNQLSFRNLLIFGFVIIISVIGIYHGLNRWEIITLGLLLILPIALWQMHNPPPVTFTVDDGIITFTFKDRSYAVNFAEINNTTIERNKRGDRKDIS